jgi:serine protease Do
MSLSDADDGSPAAGTPAAGTPSAGTPACDIAHEITSENHGEIPSQDLSGNMGGDPLLDSTPDPGQLPNAVTRASGLSNLNERAGNRYYPLHLLSSTLLSLLMVLALLLTARLLVPSLVESIRYGWHRGQLRAEYEVSGQQLRSVSLDSLAEVSQLVSRRASPSVVHINLLRDQTTLSHYETLFGAQNPNLRLEGQGSGFVIDAAGHILTNQHVVEGEGGIEVTLSDGRRLPAEIVGVDSLTDLAVLKVPATGLMAIDWGDSDAVVVGTPVWAAGSLFGLQQTVTFGIISGKHRVDFRATRYDRKVPGGTAYGDMMQSDVALNPGNSGGPLLNSMGQVVGVNAAILGETYHGVSFSIPSKVARRVADELIAQGEVARGWLGVAMEDLADNERFDVEGKLLPGVRVKGFPADLPSPARRAGLRAEDIIVEFQQQPVMNQVELMRMIGETNIGSQAQIAVLRGSDRLEFTVAIGRREAE